MFRTLKTGLRIWRRRGAAWPGIMAARVAANALLRLPRGLMVEPTQNCTGGCTGCPPPEEPEDLSPELLARWLDHRPTPPVTIHFSGKHSDPLAAPHLRELTETARRNGSMVSISTIGLGFSHGMEKLPVDRWIFSIPAATGEGWKALRGADRLEEALAAVRSAASGNAPMVELVLTVWRQSAGDPGKLPGVAAAAGAHGYKAVFGNYDPEGRHFGRVGNLALDSPECPYRLGPDGNPELKVKPRGCPLAGCLFLDASGTLRPCPFAGDDAPRVTEPSREAWRRAASWTGFKRNRAFPVCRYCP